ncbi:MAG TPA: SiaB family protein kinase [Bacteroidales bacterium]|nr:SiaB family protein kinase [Bacteroidales bacterium]
MKENVRHDLKYVSRFREHIYKNRIMLTYMGEISQEIILALLNMTEKKLDASHEDIGIKSKIFNVMVECLQNITYHNERNKYSRSSMFVISRNAGGYVIYSGNALQKLKAHELQEKLQRINDMTAPERKDFYLHWLQNRRIKGNPGAGLGLIDIARKTGSDLEFNFEEIDGEYVYFALKTVVKPKTWSKHYD